MNRDEIQVDHCYSMAPIVGRRTIARVTKLFRITAVSAYAAGEPETLELNLSWCDLYGDTPLTRQDGRIGGGNCCSMILYWLRKKRSPAPSSPLPAALVDQDHNQQSRRGADGLALAVGAIGYSALTPRLEKA
jgi:hypothetical protein